MTDRLGHTRHLIPIMDFPGNATDDFDSAVRANEVHDAPIVTTDRGIYRTTYPINHATSKLARDRTIRNKT